MAYYYDGITDKVYLGRGVGENFKLPFINSVGALLLVLFLNRTFHIKGVWPIILLTLFCFIIIVLCLRRMGEIVIELQDFSINQTFIEFEKQTLRNIIIVQLVFLLTTISLLWLYIKVPSVVTLIFYLCALVSFLLTMSVNVIKRLKVHSIISKNILKNNKN